MTEQTTTNTKEKVQRSTRSNNKPEADSVLTPTFSVAQAMRNTNHNSPFSDSWSSNRDNEDFSEVTEDYSGKEYTAPGLENSLLNPPPQDNNSSKPVIQTNRMVNADGDRYEQEADHVANLVMKMSMPSTATILSSDVNTPTISRMPQLLRVGWTSGNFEASNDTEKRINRMKDGGRTLPESERSFFETRMGYDFSNVRLHTDSNAIQASRDIQATAFTFGNNIAFNEGAYQPGTSAGRKLLAHELTHVVQQGAAVQRKPTLQRLVENTSRSEVMRYMESELGKSPSSQDIQLYRKEISDFQNLNSSAQIQAKQSQFLDITNGVNIAQRSSSQIFRKKGSSDKSPSEKEGGSTAKVEAEASPPSPPVLSKTTVSGPTLSDCGGFDWIIQWKLDKPSPKGGWIVQKIQVTENVKKSDDTAYDTGWSAHVPYWEAWRVNPNQKVTDYAEAGDVKDDQFMTPSMPDTKGTLQEKGTAQFYEGLTLPKSFKPDNSSPAGILPVTKSDPSLTGGSGVLDHTIAVAWDCSGADKSTKITSQV